MLNARERAELKSMNYSSKQHSGIKKSTLLARQKNWDFPHKKAYWFATAISHLQPFHFNNSILFQFLSFRTLYIYIPALITYFSTPPILYSSLVPTRKHQRSGKCYRETFWGIKGYSSSKSGLAISSFSQAQSLLNSKCAEQWFWAMEDSQDTASAPLLGARSIHSAAKSKESLPVPRTSIHSITLWSTQGSVPPFVSLHKHFWILPHSASAWVSGEPVHLGGKTPSPQARTG